jgi:hypothetical protein
MERRESHPSAIKTAEGWGTHLCGNKARALKAPCRSAVFRGLKAPAPSEMTRRISTK